MLSKKFAISTVIIFIMLLVTGTVVKQAAPAYANVATERFKKLDKNNDGVLTPDEAGNQKLFDRLDVNKDGKLTEEETHSIFKDKNGKKQTTRDSSLPAPAFANVKYGPHNRNIFDLWQAKSDKPTPLIVFIHGGGFVGGDKSKIPPKALQTALDAGASVMSVNYRFRESAPIQDILRDCARAIQFVRLNSANYNIDSKRIASFGSSAGAGSSLWLAVHDDLANMQAGDPVLRQSSRILAAACLNGQATYDLVEWQKVIFPYKEEWLNNPNEAAQFYHFKSMDDLETEQGKKILRDCSMLSLLSAGDPPIWMYCSVPDTEPTSRNQILHHPKHVQVIKKKGDCTGVKVETCFDAKGSNSSVMVVMFLLKHIK